MEFLLFFLFALAVDQLRRELPKMAELVEEHIRMETTEYGKALPAAANLPSWDGDCRQQCLGSCLCQGSES